MGDWSVKELVYLAAGLFGALISGLWAFLVWAHKALSSKLDKLASLDSSLGRLQLSMDALAEKVRRDTAEMSDRITGLSRSVDAQIHQMGARMDAAGLEMEQAVADLRKRVDAALADMEKRLRAGDARFSRNELDLEKTRGRLIEAMNDAVGEARKYHDQANAEFVKRDDLEANIIMVASKYCVNNCRRGP